MFALLVWMVGFVGSSKCDFEMIIFVHNVWYVTDT